MYKNDDGIEAVGNDSSMPPVLGGGGAAAMAVLPASPQTATQGNPHPHHNQTGQTQLLLAAGGGQQPQPQLLYQPYNLMPAGSPSQATAFQHHHPSSGQHQQHQAFLRDPAITIAL